MRPPRIMMCDPALIQTGIAGFNADAPVPLWTNVLHGESGDWFTRSERICGALGQFAAWHRPDLFLCEDLPEGIIQRGYLPRVKLLALIEAKIRRAGIPFLFIKPTTVKIFATGNGNAEKRDVQTAMRRTYGLACITEDEADALSGAALGCAAYGNPLAAVPDDRLRAVLFETWPDLPGVGTYVKPNVPKARRKTRTEVAT